MKWIKVLESKDQLPENRVMTVRADYLDICLTHFEGKICALDNKCPHQGGPLGEGSIENGLLRCPWHGWDYHPCTGKAPGFEDAIDSFPVEIRDDGVYVGLPEKKEAPRTISDLMVETMIYWGIDTVFGMVGHSNLGLADAFRKAAERGQLQYIGIRHEGAGAFAASAYAKLTGKPAVCFGIAGPGSTNMFTGMWDARVDRVPLLALTGQVATQVVGTGNFQEVDLVQAFSSVAEFNHRVQKDSRHAELMSLAIKHAILNRNVSHLTFPDEVQTIPVEEEAEAGHPQGRMAEMDIKPPETALEKALKLIEQAEQPMIIVGHGARFAMPSIIELAEKLQCPVATTFKGKGLISDHHPLACGVLGRSGTPVASYFMNESDLLIVFGASFSNHTGIYPYKPIIQVDFDPLALAKFHAITCPLWGEVGVTSKLLLKALPTKANWLPRVDQIAQRKKIWQQEKLSRLQDDRGQGVSAIAVFHELSELADEQAVICVDVGNNAYSLGRYFECRKQSFLMSGYLGSIGFALPAAMGAWAATRGKRQIIAVAGDGGVAQYLAEWTTVAKYQMNVKLIILNNNELAKISKEQHASQFPIWQTDLLNPDFAAFARSCGTAAFKVKQPRELKQAMQQLLADDRPALLEIKTDPFLN